MPATHHDVADLLSRLPSKIAYSCLEVALEDGAVTRIPRRELWDVRAQFMAEDDDGPGQGAEVLGDHDVKTGVYEGGFKSWESSVDLVKVLASEGYPSSCRGRPVRVIELGCGTALPSLAMFQWVLARERPPNAQPISFTLADYNPSVLQLVTLPNFLLAWALRRRHQDPSLRDAFSIEDELELGPDILDAFRADLSVHGITLSFLSGAWSPDFVQLLYCTHPAIPDTPSSPPLTVLLGAETIYSPAALRAFAETVFAVLDREGADAGADAVALVAAKRLYFGVGGSMDDFIHMAESSGGHVTRLREETQGVRRGVVRCVLSSQGRAASFTP
ncbi:hypothetical protein CDD83_8332 [Cordyceps sp. RAO-2017]|nr:hypothetical protein CDD83_8332 [Cordyceps sp. RAO-2017]